MTGRRILCRGFITSYETDLKIISGEIAVGALLVPLVGPRSRAQRLVGTPVLLAGCEVLTLSLHTAEIVDIILVATVSLVLIRETRVVLVGVELGAKILVRRHDGKVR